MVRLVPYQTLPEADLIVDAVYEANEVGNVSGEAISRLLPGVGNQGGFRPAGKGDDKKFVVLFTSGEDKDWPDRLDLGTGRFAYYGDNKRPGSELHETRRKGNELLRHVFGLLHSEPPMRNRIPPFLVFRKYPTERSSRSVQFKGLAVPGYAGLPETEDLLAVWKISDGQRFQNYRAVFTLLDVPNLRREWIEDLLAGDVNSRHAPDAWQQWMETGTYRPLIAEFTTTVRTQDEQLPDTMMKRAILDGVWAHFKDAPHAFESFAARLFAMYDQRVKIDEITRGTGDGGRDAFGRYLLGLGDDPVYVEFSLEAKCYQPPLGDQRMNSVGVRDVSRLISRIRHRQFGVLVTTSIVGRQAYQEVREDRHPIIFIAGKDIADILTAAGLNTPTLVRAFLQREFKVNQVGDDAH